jgi:hypothetical protein
MLANAKDAKQAEAVRSEIIIEIVKAWRRGKLLPDGGAPILSGILDDTAFSCRSRTARGHGFSCRCSTTWAREREGERLDRMSLCPPADRTKPAAARRPASKTNARVGLRWASTLGSIRTP